MENKDKKILLDKVFRFDNPYSLREILGKLIFATDYLLHEKDYDRVGHEELLYALRAGKEVFDVLNNHHSNDFTFEALPISKTQEMFPDNERETIVGQVLVFDRLLEVIRYCETEITKLEEENKTLKQTIGL